MQIQPLIPNFPPSTHNYKLKLTFSKSKKILSPIWPLVWLHYDRCPDSCNFYLQILGIFGSCSIIYFFFKCIILALIKFLLGNSKYNVPLFFKYFVYSPLQLSYLFNERSFETSSYCWVSPLRGILFSYILPVIFLCSVSWCSS